MFFFTCTVVYIHIFKKSLSKQSSRHRVFQSTRRESREESMGLLLLRQSKVPEEVPPVQKIPKKKPAFGLQSQNRSKFINNPGAPAPSVAVPGCQPVLPGEVRHREAPVGVREELHHENPLAAPEDGRQRAEGAHGQGHVVARGEQGVVEVAALAEGGAVATEEGVRVHPSHLCRGGGGRRRRRRRGGEGAGQ